MVKGYWYKDVLPFTAMVTVEITNVGLNTLFKAASSQGMSSYVFLCYAYATATLVLSPMAFVSHRTKVLPPFNMSILRRICLLGVIGFSAEMMSYKGIAYGSPTLASAMSNLTSAFTFILAVIFRMEKINLRSWSTRAKIMGTIVSISGALVVVLYKGPTILFLTSSSSLSQLEWIIGGLLLATAYFLFSVWYILQTQILKLYPAELIVVFLYNLCVTIMAAPICFMAERNLSAWRLKFDMALVAYVYAGFFGSSFSTVVHSWSLQLKGPVYLSSFKPLSIGIAALTGFMFLGDTLYLGSVVGVIIISVGFYAVLWGKAKEEESPVIIRSSSHSQTHSQTPLLQSQKM